MTGIFQGYIRTYGGLSYDAGELLLGKFANGAAADDCAFEIKYLFEGVPVEVDGNWIAIYLRDRSDSASVDSLAEVVDRPARQAMKISYRCGGAEQKDP